MQKNEKTTLKFHGKPTPNIPFTPIQCLGIDPGIANNGYAIVSRETPTGKFKIIDSGVIRTPANTPEAQRLLSISRKITDLLDLHEITALAIEKIFHNKNITSSISTAQVIGICQLAAAEKGIPIYQITPQQVKSAVGNRKADKKQVRTTIKLISNSTLKSHHASDAAACAIAAILFQQSPSQKFRELTK